MHSGHGEVKEYGDRYRRGIAGRTDHGGNNDQGNYHNR